VDLAFVSGALIGLIQVHGPWIIAVVVALESAGVPVCTENLSSGVVVVKSAQDGV
jgi:hypothetical protein